MLQTIANADQQGGRPDPHQTNIHGEEKVKNQYYHSGNFAHSIWEVEKESGGWCHNVTSGVGGFLVDDNPIERRHQSYEDTYNNQTADGARPQTVTCVTLKGPQVVVPCPEEMWQPGRYMSEEDQAGHGYLSIKHMHGNFHEQARAKVFSRDVVCEEAEEVCPEPQARDQREHERRRFESGPRSGLAMGEAQKGRSQKHWSDSPQ